MAKIIVVLYDDPVDGYPKTYARDAIPEIKSYPGGQTAPTPQGIDFKASCSAASPARSGSRNGPPTTGISLSSLPTRKGPTRRSTASCRMRRS